MGLEWGIPSISPRCNRRSKSPASNLAPAENGGVFISPSNQTSGLSTEVTTQLYVISDMSSIRFDSRERFWRETLLFNKSGIVRHGSDHALCEKVESTLYLCILKTGLRFSALCTG